MKGFYLVLKSIALRTPLLSSLNAIIIIALWGSNNDVLNQVKCMGKLGTVLCLVKDQIPMS